MPVLLRSELRRLIHVRASALRFARRDEGATMAEYALLIGCIVLVAMAGAKAFGTNLAGKLTNESARVANP
jgi:Flp pilus assembly pilin Flp